MTEFSTAPPWLLFLMLGVVSGGALYNLWIWLHRRSESLHLWTAGWCAITGAYLVSHYVQISAATPARVVLGARLTWMSALLLTPMLVGLTQTLTRRQFSWRPIILFCVLSAVLLPLVAFTNLIVTDQTYLRTDLLGDTYWAPVPGSLIAGLIPYVFAVFIYGFALVWRAKQLDRSDRRAFLVGFVIYAAFAINDALHAARLIQSVRVFDYAFVGVALGLTYLVVRRYARLSEGLEHEVAARTHELHVRQEQLASLVRSAQSVMAGLDLRVVLDRIMSEAARIAGTSRVEVLLVDEESRGLKVAAAAGSPAPVGSEVPLSASYGGAVAVSGQPLFVANVQSDPGNRFVRQDREAGVLTYLGLPIKNRERVLGVLSFSTESPREYSEEETACLAAFADQAAIAIENSRLYAALQDRVARLDTLTHLNRLISESLDVDRLLHQIADAAAKLMNAGLVIVWTADEGREFLYARASSDDAILADHPHRMARFGEGIIGRAAAQGRPVNVPDLGTDSRVRSGPWFLAHGFHGGMALPIVRGGQLLGVLSVVFREPFKQHLEEDPQLQAFIDQAAIAIDHGRLYAGVEMRLSRLEAVTRLNRLISSSLDSDHVLGEISKAAAHLPGVSVASFWLADEATRTLKLVGFSDPEIGADWPIRTLRFDEGATGWVARHGRYLNVPDAFKDGRFVSLEWRRRHGLKSFLGVPVMLDGALLAVLALNGREAFRLEPEDQRLLESFVGQAALAIRNASLYAAEGAARQAAERALAEVRRLQGMLPICSYCKKIRNDQNSWEQLESYISEHSHATFSHGICPDCRGTVVERDLESWRRGR
jgi:GAF domain-containing protein